LPWNETNMDKTIFLYALDNVMACCSHLPWRLFKYVCSTALLLFLFWYSTFYY
jgi:hypothetical protein